MPNGAAAALALGGTALQLGTSFLLCDEATTPALHRAALQRPGAAHTALTNLSPADRRVASSTG